MDSLSSSLSSVDESEETRPISPSISRFESRSLWTSNASVKERSSSFSSCWNSMLELMARVVDIITEEEVFNGEEAALGPSHSAGKSSETGGATARESGRS